MPTVSPRADAAWIPEFEARYAAWAAEGLGLVRAHEYGPAFKTYPYPRFLDTPWASVRTPLGRARLGVVSTAGLYRRGVDPPFADTEEGDGRVVDLPSGTGLDALDVSHSHIPEDLVRSDPGVVLPLDHLRALVGEGLVGSLAPRVQSLVGYRTRAHDVARETAPAIARAMREDGVDVALLVPV